MSLEKKSNDPDKTPVAKDLFTYCTKEKIDTWHIVRNHNATGIVEKVICKACGSEHKYRRQASLAALPSMGRPSPRKTIPTSAKKISAEESDAAMKSSWLQGLKKWGNKEVLSFDPKRCYSPGEVMEHSVFGKGVVKLRRENRVDVIFSEGMKTLPSPRPEEGASA